MVPLFASAEPAVRSMLASHARVLRRKKRQCVIRQGAAADAVFAVIQGHLKISLQSASGSAVGLTVVGPGDVFGELGVLGAVTRSAEVTALEDTMLLVIPGHAFLDACSKSALLGLSLSRFLARRLRTFAEHFGHVTGLPARTRFAQGLLALIDRFGRPNEHGIRLDLPLSQMDLAQLASLSRQRMNMLLQDLKARRIVAWEGRRLVVLDVDGLRELSRDTEA
jgi:CRP-like cAMP-binding protein